MNKLAIVAVAVLLSGCAAVQAMKTPEQLLAEDLKQYGEFSDSCEAQFGFKKGSENNKSCVALLFKKKEEQSNNQADLRRAVANAVKDGTSSYANSEPSYSSYSRQPINCTSQRMGTFTNTNCY